MEHRGIPRWRLWLAYGRFLIFEDSSHFEIVTHLTRTELVLLYWLSSSLNIGSKVVEIGSYLGASSCFLAAGLRSKGGMLHCVDTWTNIGMTEGKRDTYDEFITNTRSFSESIAIHRGLSKGIARSFQSSVDLLFVDGDHNYEAVSSDLQSWLPKLQEFSWIIMHDYKWEPGVKKAVEEIIFPLSKVKPILIDNMFATRV